MPKRVSRHSGTNQSTPRPIKRPYTSAILCPPQPPLEPTPELQRRFAELDAQHQPEDETCPLCAQGRGLPKVAYTPKHTVCIVCALMLDKAKPEKRIPTLEAPPIRSVWAVLRLPFFREWLTHPNRNTLHLSRQEAA
jgi:hypothetical protein